MTESVRILVAEDEPAIAKALELKLTHAGYQVVLAADGEAALQQIKDGKFDMLLLDLIMPKTDGFGVLEALQAKKSRLKVIVLTNLGQEEDLARAKKLGATDYFVKADTPIADVVAHVEGKLKHAD
ncbi:MAG: response regulator [Patescibacteria group bacterium]